MQSDQLSNVTPRPTGTSFVTTTYTADLRRDILHTSVSLQEKPLSAVDCNEQ